jgi:hypothetical protein
MNTTKSTSKDIENLSKLGIKDCLKLIGFEELTANIFAIPKNKKKFKQSVV